MGYQREKEGLLFCHGGTCACGITGKVDWVVWVVLSVDSVEEDVVLVESVCEEVADEVVSPTAVDPVGSVGWNTSVVFEGSVVPVESVVSVVSVEAVGSVESEGSVGSVGLKILPLQVGSVVSVVVVVDSVVVDEVDCVRLV